MSENTRVCLKRGREQAHSYSVCEVVLTYSRQVSSLLCSKLILTVDSTDDNYMPKRVTVFGGEGDNLKKLSDVTIDE